MAASRARRSGSPYRRTRETVWSGSLALSKAERWQAKSAVMARLPRSGAPAELPDGRRGDQTVVVVRRYGADKRGQPAAHPLKFIAEPDSSRMRPLDGRVSRGYGEVRRVLVRPESLRQLRLA